MIFPSELFDEINLKILDMSNTRHDHTRRVAPFRRDANELEISNVTVHMRVRRPVVAAGTILKFTIATYSRLLGKDHLAFMGIIWRTGPMSRQTPVKT